MAIGTLVIGGIALAGLGGLTALFAGKEAGKEAGNIFGEIKKAVEHRKVQKNAEKEENQETQQNQEENINAPETPTTGGNLIPIIPQENENGTTGTAIKDTTEQNVETSINASGIDYNKIFAWQEEQQKKLWEREDAIRKETQEREDNAYQRAVADMKKAGINPNLITVSPAESGGGITQATGIDMTLYKSELEKYLTELTTAINNEVKADENTKDRISDLVGNVLSLIAIYGLSRKKTKTETKTTTK